MAGSSPAMTMVNAIGLVRVGWCARSSVWHGLAWHPRGLVDGSVLGFGPLVGRPLGQDGGWRDRVDGGSSPAMTMVNAIGLVRVG
jgi:hypothetical protein